MVEGLLADVDPRPVDDPLSCPEDWYDPPATDEAKRALEFIQNCPHTKGEWRAQRKRLGDSWLPWQELATRHIFGRVRGGRRVIREAYLEMPKKSGKSHWLAAAMLYLLGPETKPGAELYSAAYDHGQAMVVWNIAKQMCEIAGWSGTRLEIRDYQGKWEIENEGTDSIYKPLTRKAASKHGFNPYAVAFDELHQQPDRELYDTIDDSQGAWSEPLLAEITNSGVDRRSICYHQREYAISNNQGRFEDESFLGVVYGAHPEEDDPWSEDTWRKANPGVPVTVDIETVRQKAEQAERVPSKQNAFKRWQLGIWTQQSTRWLRPTDWDRCEEPFQVENLSGAACYGGLDLGAVDDLTAWVKAFPDPNDPELVRLTCDVWCPKAKLYDKSNPHRDEYQAWKREGHLHVVDGSVMDYGPVKQKIIEDATTYNLVDLAVDTAFQGNQLLIELVQEEGLEAAGMKTTYNHMTSPCDEFERRILMEPEKGGPKIRHDGHPVLAWAIGNVALKQPDPDRKRPVQDTPEAKIDPVVAALMALDRAMRHAGQTSSYSGRFMTA